MILFPLWLLVFFAFVLGTAIGSFLNVVIWRLPREEGMGGRSHCPNCLHQLSAYNLIPVLSFLIQRGKCKYCQKPVSWRYLIIELATGLLFAATLYIYAPLSISDLAYVLVALFAVAVCVAVFVIDLEHYLILDKIVYPATAVVLVANIAYDLVFPGAGFFRGFAVSSLMGLVVAFVPFYSIWAVSGGKWMGFGDVKFAAFMGVLLGPVGFGVALFVAVLSGTIVSIPLLVAGKKQLTSKIPFGTFLAIGTLISLWWSVQIISWYLNLLGL